MATSGRLASCPTIRLRDCLRYQTVHRSDQAIREVVVEAALPLSGLSSKRSRIDYLGRETSTAGTRGRRSARREQGNCIANPV